MKINFINFFCLINLIFVSLHHITTQVQKKTQPSIAGKVEFREEKFGRLIRKAYHLHGPLIKIRDTN